MKHQNKAPKVTFASELAFGLLAIPRPAQARCLAPYDVTAPQLDYSELGWEELCTVFFSFPSSLVLPDVLITEERERMILPICLHSTQINLLAVLHGSVALRLSHRNGCCRL